MHVNDVFNKVELSNILISELKQLGVKYRKEKKSKFAQEKCGRKRIFHVHLHQLNLTDVLLTNGGVVQIPYFVANACQRICEQIETEGIFRKTGSHLRQKEIRINIENGLPLDKNYHVIDIANVLKSFFRELPEPLLPSHIQEVLLRGFLLAEGKLKAMLLGCLLLPPLTLNTLTFFMQFLKKVSSFSDINKMTISNLAIIFTPGLMPLNDIGSIRFNNHVKIVQFLIQNAESIGLLPNDIVSKLSINTTPVKSVCDESPLFNGTEKKKKKRRSGSLNRMFNGIKKIVGAISSSSENLENTPETTIMSTPCITKSNKKRKMVETVTGFSTKKKKEFLNMFPDGNLLPNTPLCIKETKKPRISLTGRKHTKHTSSNNNQSSISASIERRWSVVGSAWTRKKNSVDVAKNKVTKTLSPVISLPNIPDINFTKMTLETNKSEIYANSTQLIETISTQSLNKDNESLEFADFVRVPKHEYEAIKERVKFIEKRISQEFNSVQKSLNNNDNSLEHNFDNSFSFNTEMSGPERVLNKFEKTVEQTEKIISPSTDQLAKRLSRDLKIRRNSENRVIRSPSARKIGSMRRRSKEKIRLSRNATWHISSTSNLNNQNSHEDKMNGIAFYPRSSSNLKRGRPNTVQTGLHNPVSIGSLDVEEGLNQESFQINMCDNNQNEKNTENHSEGMNKVLTKEWVDGAVFFDDDIFPQTPKNRNNTDIFGTPRSRSSKRKSITPNYVTPSVKFENEEKTPMLPPKTVPRKTCRTPGSAIRSVSNKHLFTPLTEENPTGRASIARLRAFNAGMVLAKAKLFDDMDHHQTLNNCPLVKSMNSPVKENRRQSSRFVIKKFEEPENFGKIVRVAQKSNGKENSPCLNKTPRRPNNYKSPGCIQKRSKLSLTRYPDKRLLTNIIQENSPSTTPVLFNQSSNKNVLVKNMENTIRQSPRNSTTPRIKKNIKINSPRKYVKVTKISGQQSGIRTPLRATAVVGLRQSPRLQQTNKKF